MLKSLNHLHGPSEDSLVCPNFSCAWDARTGHSTLKWPHQYFRNGKDLLPWLAGNISPNMAQDTFSLCCKGVCGSWQLGIQQDSRLFPAKLLSSWSGPCLRWCMGLFLWRCQACHFSLWHSYLCKVLVSPFLQPIQIPEDGSTTPWTIRR